MRNEKPVGTNPHLHAVGVCSPVDSRPAGRGSELSGLAGRRASVDLGEPAEPVRGLFLHHYMHALCPYGGNTVRAWGATHNKCMYELPI